MGDCRRHWHSFLHGAAWCLHLEGGRRKELFQQTSQNVAFGQRIRSCIIALRALLLPLFRQHCWRNFQVFDLGCLLLMCQMPMPASMLPPGLQEELSFDFFFTLSTKQLNGRVLVDSAKSGPSKNIVRPLIGPFVK